MLNSIVILSQKAYTYVTRFISPNFLKTTFEFIGFDLKRAGIFVTPEEYGALTIMTASITFFFTSISLILAFSLLFKSIAGGLLIGILGGLILSFIVVISFIIYPKNKIMENERKITAALPFATYYLITIANSGANIVQMFKILSNMHGYSAIAQEAKRIVFMVENTGYDITDALKMASDRTPSQQFRDLLWGIRNTIIVGGNLLIYLREKANLYFQEYKRYLVKYSQQLSLLVEVYTTVMLVGATFLVVLTLVMGLLYRNIIIPFIQLTTIFIAIPLVSGFFIILFKTLNIEE